MGKCETRVLSSDEVGRLREETIKILAEVGVKFSHEGAKKMLRDAGAKVDPETDLVLVPARISEECLKRVPRRILYGGRDPDGDIIIGPDNYRVYPRSISGAESYIDLHTGEYRKTRISDVKDWAILVDALENIAECTAPYYGDEGYNLQARDVRAFEILLENTTKHIVMQLYGPQNLEFCIKMAVAERGGEAELKKRPRFSIHVSPVPPLNYHANTVDQILTCGKYGIPVELCTIQILGLNSPVTVAGGVLMALAEHLAAVVLLQLAHPGAPLMIAPRCMPTDMTRGAALAGPVEHAMAGVALVQVAKEGFGWQVNTITGTDSFVTDGQNIMERCFDTILTGCAGADTMSGMGQLASYNALDPALLVIDNEICGMTLRARKGMEINNETLALDAIRKVGVGSGKTFLAEEHTRRYFRSEFFKPRLATRVSQSTWEAGGKKDLYQKARERALSILKEHKVPPLKDGVVKRLRSLTEEAEREIRHTTTV